MRTYNSVDEALQSIRDQRLESSLIRVTIIFLSPVTMKYEYRVAYFHERVEADIWKEFIVSKYDELGIQYTSYLEVGV